MDTKKFEFLEAIREAIETEDYEELDEYVEDIREEVKTDPDFTELFGEIRNKRYVDAISLIDEFVYEDIKTEFGDSFDEKAIEHLNNTAVDTSKKFPRTGDQTLPENISFEEFNDEEFSVNTGFEEEG